MDAAETVTPPLHGVRVLDLTTGPMEVLSRHFTDLGAHVIRVRVAGVTRDDPLGPVVRGVAIGSALAALGTSTIRLGDSAESAAEWDDLLASADLLIENTVPGSPEEQHLDVARIHAAHPALVILSISDYGRGTAFSSWQLTSPVAHALTSELSRSGIPDREPLIPPGELPYHVAAAQAALMAVAVYLDRLRTGHGSVLDFSVLEGAMQALDPAFGMTGSAAAGVPLSQAPRGRAEERYKYPILPCADGFVRICVLAQRQWRGMFEWLGRPEEFADPSFDNIFVRFNSPTLLPAIAAMFATRTRAELEEQGQQHGVPTAALLSLEEALDSEQIRAREFFGDVELAPGLVVPVPRGIMEIDGRRAVQHEPPAEAPRPSGAPILGARERHDPRLPLDGIRVLDFGVIVVGGDTGRLLGDLGADVIKVENSAFLDGARASQGPDSMSPGFAAGHRNKRSIGINLRDPRGIELVQRLAADSDIVLTNFKPGVIASLGLDYGALKAVNPGIVVVDSSAFGATGPWSKRLGYGPLVRAATGFTGQWSYPGEPASFSDAATVYPDHVCARLGALAALALLIRRESTGLGGSVSIAQSEVMLSEMADEIALGALQRAGLPLDGQRHDAPWGLYPAQGDDDWLAVTVRGDQEWSALCDVTGLQDLARDATLRDSAGRDAARERIDAAVAAWSSSVPAAEAMELLQQAGVPAGMMLRAIELPDWEYYAKRRDFRVEEHPRMTEPVVLENTQIHSAEVADPPTVPAPLLGQHTREVSEELLNLDSSQIDALIEAGVLESAVERVPQRT